MAARVAVILADAIVIGATWMRMYHHSREVRAFQVRVSASAIILRDGTSIVAVLCSRLTSTQAVYTSCA